MNIKNLFEMFSKPDAEDTDLNPLWDMFFEATGTDTGREPEIPKTPVCLKFNPAFIYFCLNNLPIKEALRSLCIIGMPGSGKTVLMKLMVMSLTSREGKLPPNRKIIYYDAKGDGISFFASLGFGPDHPQVFIMNPYDDRCCEWSIAETVQDPSNAYYFSALLIPEEPNSTSPYFPDGARILVFCVILGLNASKKTKWTFRDLLCALHSVTLIKEIASLDPLANMLCHLILDDDKHGASVLSTITTKVARFSQVAALTSAKGKKRRKFSLDEFFNSSGILIIRYDPVYKDSLDPYNSLLYKAAVDIVLRRDETLEPNIVFIWDEANTFARTGKQNPMGDLMEFGRSKGCIVFMGVQSIAAMHEAFGKENTDRIMGLIAHKTILKVSDPTTAQYCEDYFNKIRGIEKTYTQSWNKDGTSWSVNYALQDRTMVLGSVFLSLPFPRPGGKFYAISDVPAFDCTLFSSRDFSTMLSWFPKKVDIADNCPRTKASDQRLLPWTDIERAKMTKVNPLAPPPIKTITLPNFLQSDSDIPPDIGD